MANGEWIYTYWFVSTLLFLLYSSLTTSLLSQNRRRVEQFEEVYHGRDGLLLIVRCQEVIGKGMPYFVQVYMKR